MGSTLQSSLLREWEASIKDQLSNGETPSSVLSTILSKSRADVSTAVAAIEEVRTAHFPDLPGPQPVPEIDTSKNTIRTHDRVVDVLLTVRSPRIVLLGNVLGDEECDSLCAYIEPRLERSTSLGSGLAFCLGHSNKAGY